MTEQAASSATASGRHTRWDCLAIALSATVPLLLLAPLHDTPFIDDWTYAWSVETLLQGGGLQRLDWSVHDNVSQVLWGALFCLPGVLWLMILARWHELPAAGLAEASPTAEEEVLEGRVG